MMNLPQVSTSDEFIHWANNARYGDKICYFEGPRVSTGSGRNSLGQVAWDFYQADKVILVQRRLDEDGNFAYIAVRGCDLKNKRKKK